MKRLRRGWSRLLGVFAGRRRERELAEELASHVQMQTEDNIRAGMSSGEARREARLKFGNVESAKENVRDQRGLPKLESFLMDARYAMRGLRKNPGFAAAAIITLALGIGANTAMFSVVNAVLLRPLAFPEPDRLVQLLRRYPTFDTTANSVPVILHWQQNQRVFEHVAAYQFLPMGYNLSGSGDPELVMGIQVSAELLPVLGVAPALGRGFAADEDRPGAPRVVVLSDGLWRTRFAADASLLGQTITLNAEQYTLIGVMPPGFQYPPGTELWTPLRLPAVSTDRANLYNVIARLKPGVTTESAEAQMTVMHLAFVEENPQFANADRVGVAPLAERLTGELRSVLLILLGAVSFVLLIACANVANMLLGRSATRRREIAVRGALGAGRGRIVRQLLSECIVLSLIAGAMGVSLGWWSLRGLEQMIPQELPRGASIDLDPGVLMFTLAVSIGAALLFGLAPALQASRLPLNSVLKEASVRTTGSGGKTQSALVISEVALALVLLAGVALLLGSFRQLQQVEPGFNPRNVLTMAMFLPEAKYSAPEPLALFYRQVLDRVSAIPGVRHVSLVTSLPLEGGPDLPFDIEGRPKEQPDQPTGGAQYRAISAEYFRAMEIPLRRGRHFTERDTMNSPGVVIMNEALARRYFQDEDPIGQQITIGKAMGPSWSDPAPREVAGIVGDVHDSSLERPPQPMLYIPYGQMPAAIVPVFVREIPTRWVIKTEGSPLGVVEIVRREVMAVDGAQAIANIRTLEQIVKLSSVRRRFSLVLLGIFASLALLLAAVGIYGVMAHAVMQRTAEIGVRVALGASQPDILRLIVRQAMRPALIGVVLGLGGALALGPVMSSFVFNVSPYDPLTLAAAAALLAVVALVASLVPALRAARVNPISALRYE